jgi:hypothetical protein
VSVEPENHPVWNLYDEMRTARLNVKCLQCEVRKLRNWNRFFEITLAVASTSSIGGFWFMQNLVGGYVWKTLGAAAIILTALKPVFKLNEKIREKHLLLVGYHALDHDLHCIAIEVRQQQRYDNELHKELVKALKRKAELRKKHDGERINRKCQKRCENEVAEEMPANSFYIPTQ